MEMFIRVVCCCVLLWAHMCARAESEPHADFSKADSIAARYGNHSLKDMRALSDKLTRNLYTEKEKFRSIYRWVCDNIEYDYTLYLKNQRKRKIIHDQYELNEWDREFGKRVFKTLLDNHKTVCTGYAYLLQALSAHAGISCRTIDGYGRTAQSNVGGQGLANHTWNAVRLDGTWYLCDATWSAGAYDLQRQVYVRKFDDGYFLTPPSAFARNHYPLDTSWMLMKSHSTLQDFLNAPLVYSSAAGYGLGHLSPGAFNVTAVRGAEVLFEFSHASGQVIKKAEAIVKGPGVLKSFTRQLQHDADRYALAHTFTGKGIYVVHILLNDQAAITYRVDVR